jgi:hypothetical protein
MNHYFSCKRAVLTTLAITFLSVGFNQAQAESNEVISAGSYAVHIAGDSFFRIAQRARAACDTPISWRKIAADNGVTAEPFLLKLNTTITISCDAAPLTVTKHTKVASAKKSEVAAQPEVKPEVQSQPQKQAPPQQEAPVYKLLLPDMSGKDQKLAADDQSPLPQSFWEWTKKKMLLASGTAIMVVMALVTLFFSKYETPARKQKRLKREWEIDAQRHKGAPTIEERKQNKIVHAPKREHGSPLLSDDDTFESIAKKPYIVENPQTAA